MLELPLVIVNVQRGGPSTGLPTKTEQADLLQAVFGRNGEAPLCVMAPSTPADCFDMAYEAARIAIKYMTPVICLTDGYLGERRRTVENSRTSKISRDPGHVRNGPEDLPALLRDPKRRSRGPGPSPGPPDSKHRIGGLEKADHHR